VGKRRNEYVADCTDEEDNEEDADAVAIVGVQVARSRP
jgi:hypothetical protein